MKYITPHINSFDNSQNPQYGLTLNFQKETTKYCLGLNVYIGKKVIHLGLLFI